MKSSRNILSAHFSIAIVYYTSCGLFAHSLFSLPPRFLDRLVELLRAAHRDVHRLATWGKKTLYEKSEGRSVIFDFVIDSAGFRMVMAPANAPAQLLCQLDQLTETGS